MIMIEETLKELLERAENNINYPICKEYNEIAMRSPENMAIAIKLVKDQFWRMQVDKTYTRKYPVSCYTAPWVADKDAKYIGSIMIPMTGLTSWSDDDDPREREMHVFDVHGEMKPCTHMSENKTPITMGCAYEKMPEKFRWI